MPLSASLRHRAASLALGCCLAYAPLPAAPVADGDIADPRAPFLATNTK